jgi:hypothetical protein
MTSYLIQWSPTKEPDAYDRRCHRPLGLRRPQGRHAGDEVFVRRSGPDRPGIILRGRITGFTKPKPTFMNGASLRAYWSCPALMDGLGLRRGLFRPSCFLSYSMGER